MAAQDITTATLQVYAEATNHFQTSNTECDICKSADAPEPTRDAIVRLHVCNHIFHHHCIDVWLVTQLNRPNETSHGTCPLCRGILVEHPNPDPDPETATLRREAGRLAEVLDSTTATIADLRRRFPASYDVLTEEGMQHLQRIEGAIRAAERSAENSRRRIVQVEAVLRSPIARL
jgi:molybdopterin converting factor small subunit